MLIEGQPVTLSPELMQIWREPVGVLLLHDIEGFAAARASEAVCTDAAATGHDGSAHQTVIKGRCNHGRLAVARGTGDDELLVVDGGVRYEKISDARDAPGPARENAPVIARVSRIETRLAEGPTAIGVAEGGVLGAVVGVEHNERVAATENERILQGNGLSAEHGSGGPGRRRGCWR